MGPVVVILAHVAVTLMLPPLLLGVIQNTKAVFAGRQGPPLLQPYRDLARLLQKRAVLSTTTTWVFLLGPVAGLVTALFAALIVPLGGAAPLSFAGDFVVVVGLLALGRFLTVLAAFDCGSSFEGMGGAREASFSALAEPGLFLALVVLARATGTDSLMGMLGPGLAAVWPTAGATLAAVAVAAFVLLLVENSRIPFDDPATHLELTMIHEVMVLDHSGPPLALIGYGAALKLFVFGAVVVGVVLPVGNLSYAVALPLSALGLLLLAAAIGVVESSMARLRLTTVPNLLIASALIAAFGAVLLLR